MSKSDLRKKLRAARKAHVAQQPDAIRALLFNRPPAPLLEMIDAGASIGLYHATPDEARTSSYAAFFHEAGHTIALPYFDSEGTPMGFREHVDPYEESDLETGAYGIQQPKADSAAIIPDIAFVPLVGFTEEGERLGQGGGHYDRFLAKHPDTLAIGLAWDVQLCDKLPTEPHDMRLDAVITPTRLYGPF